MVQRCKTALCVLALMLALLAAWVQEATWTDRPAVGEHSLPTVTVALWNVGLDG